MLKTLDQHTADASQVLLPVQNVKHLELHVQPVFPTTSITQDLKPVHALQTTLLIVETNLVRLAPSLARPAREIQTGAIAAFQTTPMILEQKHVHAPLKNTL